MLCVGRKVVPESVLGVPLVSEKVWFPKLLVQPKMERNFYLTVPKML